MEKTAVILIGGQSKRMGEDKSLLEYHGVAQKEYLIDMLQSIGFTTFLAGREEQKDNKNAFLVDAVYQCGPASGVLSALQTKETGSVVVVCCDQPLIDAELIQSLWDMAMQTEDTVVMSCFERETEIGVAESFPSVWKVSARLPVQQALNQGHYRVRDMLKTEQMSLHRCPDYSKLMNVNTPYQWQSWRKEHVLE